MEDATITIDEVVTRKPDFVKFKAQGKTFNCNVKKYMQDASDGRPVFSEGRKLDVAFNEYQPEGQKFASRYINECRPAEPPDKPNTWADKEPYDPSRKSGGGGNSSGGKKQADEFRSKDQVNRSHTLHAICVLRQGASMTVDELLEECDIADNWVMGGSLAEHVAAAVQQLDATPVPDDEIPF